jgi:GT2 family glycosyltransferase
MASAQTLTLPVVRYTERLGPRPRPAVKGKFLWRGEQKLHLRGVTYGPFHPEEDGCEYHTPAVAAHDFSMMVAAGINTIRVYTVPPVWLLDLARRHGLLVLAGLPWEQHVTFLDDSRRVAEIERRVREGVRSLAGHPALLGLTVGNEIPASIVRWHGRKRIELFLRRLYTAAKEEDPGALVTYVNFPSTEYLELDFLDFICFNVYLESKDRLEAYLARLHNLASEKPLVMAEVGLDSRRNGLLKQAETLDWQVRSVFSSGAAGVFVFAWTDEWHRGGYDIEDWDFGLTTRHRMPKSALAVVQNAFAETPICADAGWPAISVVVCSYNGSRTIRDTLDHVHALDYPNFEVIVVSDGSTDRTGSIARGYPGVRVIETANQGLSAARNEGMQAAAGEIIAYIDDDAYPDSQWLQYLAHAFRSSTHAAIGGPNVPPQGEGPIAECVAKAPGGPIHVLVSDDLAEHIPGCNFAIRKSALEAIGGWDPIYRAAGDDVDVCWRLQARGLTIGFHPGAVVWHHRRNSFRAYWRQQRGYGKAEALLEQKWPEKYNAVGHLNWAGRLYGAGVLRGVALNSRIYHGTWNSAPFQLLYQPPAPLWQALPQMPEWYMVNLALGGLCLLGLSWAPLLWFLPLLALGVLLPMAQIVAAVARTPFSRPELRLVTAGLFVLQPMARLWGRFAHGLTPWRRRESAAARPLLRPCFTHATWSETFRSATEWLELLRSNFRSRGAIATRGGDFDHWDFHIRGGLFTAVVLQLAVEEHGAGKQLLRWRVWPRVSTGLLIASAILAALTLGAAKDHARIAAAGLGGCVILMLLRAAVECARAMGSARGALENLQ